MRIGLEEAGGECILTCEINEDALSTYRLNYTPNRFHRYHNDILTLKNQHIPEHDILVAGFPCQPYSLAGLRQGLNDQRGRTYI